VDDIAASQAGSVQKGGGGETAAVPAALAPSLHVKARGPHPRYPDRFPVPDTKVPWSSTWLEYNPTRFTAAGVLSQDCTVKSGGWADPADPSKLSAADWAARTSYEGAICYGDQGVPRNPCGRTGLAERGALGKWGPNHAADPIVTRYDPKRPQQLQMVAIKRKDTGEWAIPGGMVDPGEAVSATVKREFTEEAGDITDAAERARFEELTAKLFQNDKVVYRGYVDDPRNTDHAWMETTALHFHCDEELGRMLPLNAGDDAADVMWLDVDDSDERYSKLYASHRLWVDRVAQNLRAR